VAVTVPTGLDRAAEIVAAPVRRVTTSLAGFELRRCSPLGAWTEAVAYRERDGTLDDSMQNARRRLPRALVSTVPRELRGMIDAIR
jgi:hypothetical protein